jgi:hypothetical protein
MSRLSSLIGWAVIMYVKIIKSDVIVLICNIIMCLTSHWILFSSIRDSSLTLTISLSQWGQRKCVQPTYRVRKMCQSCQTWPAKFGQILLRTDTRLIFCNRKLMRTDIFFTRTTKPICNFANSVLIHVYL